MSAPSNLKQTRMVARGYTKPRYVCFDCERVTASVMLVYRGGFTESDTAFVCKPDSGCHKGMSASEVYAQSEGSK